MTEEKRSPTGQKWGEVCEWCESDTVPCSHCKRSTAEIAHLRKVRKKLNDELAEVEKQHNAAKASLKLVVTDRDVARNRLTEVEKQRNEAVEQRNIMHDTLTRAQARCTELLMENRKLKEAMKHDATGVGTPHVRDPEHPCEVFVPGTPGGHCMGDGHYLCASCEEMKGYVSQS